MLVGSILDRIRLVPSRLFLRENDSRSVKHTQRHLQVEAPPPSGEGQRRWGRIELLTH